MMNHIHQWGALLHGKSATCAGGLCTLATSTSYKTWLLLKAPYPVLTLRSLLFMATGSQWNRRQSRRTTVIRDTQRPSTSLVITLLAYVKQREEERSREDADDLERGQRKRQRPATQEENKENKEVDDDEEDDDDNDE